MSAIPEQSADLEGYLAEKGYETHRYEWFGEEANPKDEEVIKKLGGVSFMYLGVQPPLKDEHIQEFAGWCRNNVDPYHNSGLLIDNRNTLSPIEPFSYSPSDVVADW
jgi:hypothetical protein